MIFRRDRCARIESYHEGLWHGGQETRCPGYLFRNRQGNQRRTHSQWIYQYYDQQNGK